MLIPRAPTTVPPVPAVLFAALSVEGGAAVAKTLFPVLGPVTTLGLRIGLSAVLLLLVFRPSRATLTAPTLRAVVPFGLALGSMNLLFYLALARIPLGLAVTLEFVGPLLLSVLLSRRPLDFVWAALAGLGVLLIAPWGGQELDMLGVVFALLAGACWAAYVVLGGRVSQVVPGGTGVALGMLVVTFVALPLMAVDGGFARVTPWLLLVGLGVAVLSSAVPYTLEMLALRQLPARTFSVLLSLSPAVAAVCGVLVLGEHLTVAQWTAVVLVMLASAGATVTTERGSKTDKEST